MLDPLTGERLGSTDALGARSLRLFSTPDHLALTVTRTDGGRELLVFSRETRTD